MIFWEIMSGENIPFESYNINAIYNALVKNNERPPLYDNWINEIKFLIKGCWDFDPLKRPNLKQIINILEELSLKNDEYFNQNNIISIKFENNQLLPSGSFFKIYYGDFKYLQNVCFKTFSKDETDSYFAFYKELKILKEIKSEYIIKYLHDFETEYFYVLVMELPKEKFLNDFLKKFKKDNSYNLISWEKKYQICLDISKSIKIIHENNIIHRDIKSLNIFIDENFRAKLSNFSVCKLVNQKKELDKFQDDSTGTINWKAPETYDDEFTFESDIYSLGIVFWEILTGDFPFENEPGTIKNKIINENYRPPIIINSPSIFISLIKKCWDQDLLKRPSIDSIIKVLEYLYLNELNNSKAKYELGCLYLNGEIFEKDISIACKWF